MSLISSHPCTQDPPRLLSFPCYAISSRLSDPFAVGGGSRQQASDAQAETPSNVRTPFFFLPLQQPRRRTGACKRRVHARFIYTRGWQPAYALLTTGSARPNHSSSPGSAAASRDVRTIMGQSCSCSALLVRTCPSCKPRLYSRERGGHGVEGGQGGWAAPGLFSNARDY